MLADKELEFIEQEIVELVVKLDETFSRYIFNSMVYEEDYNPEIDEGNIVFSTQRLFKNMVVYFEAKGLNQYAETFRAEFEELIKDRKKVLEYNRFDIDGDEFNKIFILDNFRQRLAPFKRLGSKKSETIDEINKLVDILLSTPQILELTKSNVTNEKSIYEPVRNILDLYYHTNKVPSRFIGKFKNY